MSSNGQIGQVGPRTADALSSCIGKTVVCWAESARGVVEACRIALVMSFGSERSA